MCQLSDVTTKCHSHSYHMSCNGLKDLTCICAIVCLWVWRHRLPFLFLGFHIYTTYFGNCLVCLGGCTWCACGCDCLGIPLRPVVLGERHILSLRKATKLHLWSDRGMKCHKQLLHRQPAVTMAVEPVSLWQQEHTFKEYDFSSPVCLCRNPNPKSNNTRTARKVRVLNSNGRDKKALSSGGSTDCVA